ncbi:MAG: hypothetical protein KDI13_07915 [Alphaproteobacteria bacterium]|nr:hypothetical protein [Alphaproteobacteria bacterium]
MSENLNVFNILAAGSGLVCLAGTGSLLVSPTLTGLLVTAASLVTYCGSRQIGIYYQGSSFDDHSL